MHYILLATENCLIILTIYSKDFAINEIKKNTRRFAKKQITWLKNSDEKHQWIDVDYDIQEILKI